ncbi:MAG: 23S rRNA (adenine(2503)-C(2))-methyltransferase RlmN [Acidimicrobiia bacterium]|nr:23S rRNA (adenine(2503)-C(2))-methyltransferase RlmN [Acidimicrobiia bacterium]
MTSQFDPDRDEWTRRLAEEPAYRAEQLWQGLYLDLTDLADISTLPRGLRDRLAAELPVALAVVTESVSADGETVKWLWALEDGAEIETVLMHYPERSTVCVSTQAGCAMACGFCATGQGGFERNLTTGEIVEQVVRAARRARTDGRRVSNVVLMGMGEPLANYDRTLEAVHRMHGALGLSARHLTLSTVGLVPGIRRLADEPLPINLAVSLHAADDALRDQLVPINRRYPLADLVAACEHHQRAHSRRLSFEWALIDGVNDRDEDAARLAEIARHLRAHVNLIPLNRTPGWPTTGSPPERVTHFRRLLERRGVVATVRANRGTDIDAACGQLRAASRDGRSSTVTMVEGPTARGNRPER